MLEDNKNAKRPWREATRLVHAGTTRSPFGETSEALFLTQGYLYPSMEAAEARFKGEAPGFIYSRFSNPTVAMFEERMAQLEGAEAARATATGMAAVLAAIMSQVKAGDHIVAAKAMFSSCRYIIEDLMPRFGVACTLVDGCDLSAWERAITPQTKITFLESPTNPTLEIIDIAAVAELSHRVGACLIVDNVFATPLLQKPLELGADCVVYSATKHIDGQGRCLGGVILGTQTFINDHIHNFLRQTGPSLSPFNAWVLLKSLETLPLRVQKQQENAMKIAEFLSAQHLISRVIYPGRTDHPQAGLIARQMRGGSSLIAFDVAGGKEAAFILGNALKLIGISNNLGDAKSLVTHPASSTHQRLSPEARADMGIGEGLLRLSVGLEDAQDLIEDLDNALGVLEERLRKGLLGAPCFLTAGLVAAK